MRVILKISTDKDSLESFGKTLTIVLFLLSAYWRHKGHADVSQNFLYAAFFFSLVSLFIPTSIKYLYLGWMNLVNGMATVITTVLIGITDPMNPPRGRSLDQGIKSITNL